MDIEKINETSHAMYYESQTKVS